MSDDDEIAKRLAALPEPDMTDPDNPEWTEEDFARARPIEEVLSPEVIAAAFPRWAEKLGSCHPRGRRLARRSARFRLSLSGGRRSRRRPAPRS